MYVDNNGIRHNCHELLTAIESDVAADGRIDLHREGDMSSFLSVRYLNNIQTGEITAERILHRYPSRTVQHDQSQSKQGAPEDVSFGCDTKYRLNYIFKKKHNIRRNRISDVAFPAPLLRDLKHSTHTLRAATAWAAMDSGTGITGGGSGYAALLAHAE